MITAIDTNIIVALWTGTVDVAAIAREALEQASSTGSLVITPPVYAELIAAPGRSRDAIDTFLLRTQIEMN